MIQSSSRLSYFHLKIKAITRISGTFFSTRYNFDISKSARLEVY